MEKLYSVKEFMGAHLLGVFTTAAAAHEAVLEFFQDENEEDAEPYVELIDGSTAGEGLYRTCNDAFPSYYLVQSCELYQSRMTDPRYVFVLSYSLTPSEADDVSFTCFAPDTIVFSSAADALDWLRDKLRREYMIQVLLEEEHIVVARLVNESDVEYGPWPPPASGVALVNRLSVDGLSFLDE